MRIVEINGIKLEIDERTARTVEQYRVGDPVKVLVKAYGGQYNVYPGVVAGFCDFQALPTIQIMYLDGSSFNTESFKFININAKTEGHEICPLNELEHLLDRNEVVQKFDRAIDKMVADLAEMRLRKAYFEEKFAKMFESVAS